ncbi:hypothetical protein R3W88_004483 [Solanum pinnatisectum]|uniref:RING-type domain-containing protein n=1 Tax=Solanum pinnatisectum TaxID=50273 RepID=A0AAV9KBU8_9SOLN|nr:hypothetical protein R3W88_004483 [Solanum pinnatisectum]
MLMVWHKLKKALSLKRKDNNSQNETHHSKSLAIPSSPSSLSSLPSPTAHSSKETCVICLGSMKAGKGKAIFTAECSHSFHFSCIGENVKYGNLLCPICRCKWKEIPFQFGTDDVTIVRRIRVLRPVNRSRPLPTIYPPAPQHVQFLDGGPSIIDVIGYNIGSDVQHSGRG